MNALMQPILLASYRSACPALHIFLPARSLRTLAPLYFNTPGVPVRASVQRSSRTRGITTSFRTSVFTSRASGTSSCSSTRRMNANSASPGDLAGFTLPVPTVSASWLQDHLDSVKEITPVFFQRLVLCIPYSNLIRLLRRFKQDKARSYEQVVDASWYMPNVDRDAKAEFEGKRIPGAVFLDLDGVADMAVELPHMLPSPGAFSAAADALGISNDSPVVVYDGSGLFSAARAWWMFKAFGHRQVATLEGGLPGWEERGYEVEVAPPAVDVLAGTNAVRAVDANTVPAGKYQATLDPAAVRSVTQMLANLESSEEQVVDARSAGRFAGTAPEPRAGIRGGHIPNSCNVPFDIVLSKDKGLKSEAELKEIFTASGLCLDGKPIAATCGTGVTACVLALALDKIGVKNVSVYDGSWTEWGGREDTPVVP